MGGDDHLVGFLGKFESVGHRIEEQKRCQTLVYTTTAYWVQECRWFQTDSIVHMHFPLFEILNQDKKNTNMKCAVKLNSYFHVNNVSERKVSRD